MWEQIFEAFEEQPADLVRSTMDATTEGWGMFSVPRQRLGMNDRYDDFNPGTQKLDLHFACASACDCVAHRPCLARRLLILRPDWVCKACTLPRGQSAGLLQADLCHTHAACRSACVTAHAGAAHAIHYTTFTLLSLGRDPPFPVHARIGHTMTLSKRSGTLQAWWARPNVTSALQGNTTASHFCRRSQAGARSIQRAHGHGLHLWCCLGRHLPFHEEQGSHRPADALLILLVSPKWKRTLAHIGASHGSQAGWTTGGRADAHDLF